MKEATKEKWEIVTTPLGEGFTLEFNTGWNKNFIKFDPEIKKLNDIQIKLVYKGKILLSAISKYGSFGVEEGLWEIMPNHTPKSWKSDTVLGHLDFFEVWRYILREIKFVDMA